MSEQTTITRAGLTAAELEIGLHRWDADNYAVELRFTPPDGEADVRLVRGGPSLVHLDREHLRSLELDTRAYGGLLGQCLMGDPKVRTAFALARASAASLNAPLRFRLLIGSDAPELHGVRWETMRDPEDGADGAALFTKETILFSRYLSSYDWRPVQLRPPDTLRALVAIANPAGLSAYQPGGRPLAPVDVDGERARAEAGLRGSGNGGETGIAVTCLASGGEASLDNIHQNLRDGYDILYLVCHGSLDGTEPRLWLEDHNGNVAVVPGSDLVTRLQELRQPPRLVILASCQSAGGCTDDEGTLATLGPRLAEAGIPAVLAMQGNVTMQTVASFMPVFFTELQKDGEIDHAVAVARGAVRDQPDFWMPVLFMRLRRGRIWSPPSSAADRQPFGRWPALLSSIEQGRCTPILGPGLLQPLLGTSRGIARRWADTYDFPMAPSSREDLPQVAQYLAVNQDYMFLRAELEEYIRQELLHRYGRDLPADRRRSTLDELISTVGGIRRAADPLDAHRVLAHLPFPIYITTMPDNMLADALREAGRDPQVVIYQWNPDLDLPPTVYDREPEYRPSPERPLVYHLFGNLRKTESVVLTEDDYFDYLTGAISNRDLIPSVVRRALAATALLFLGHQVDDWDFRVLFRSIRSREVRPMRERLTHVAVQIDPDAGHMLEPDRARAYLERYFQNADISIYWGGPQDFISELASRSVNIEARGEGPDQGA